MAMSAQPYPRVFPACAITRCLRKLPGASVVLRNPTMFDLSETFMCGPDFAIPPELTSPLKTLKLSKFVGPLKERGSIQLTLQCLGSSWLLNIVKMFSSLLFLLRYVQRRSLMKFVWVTLTEMVFWWENGIPTPKPGKTIGSVYFKLSTRDTEVGWRW